MRSGGRIAAAMEVLAEVEGRHRPISVALKDWGVAHRFAGSGDRAAIGNIVYDALRWRASSAWIMGEDTARAVVLATMAHRWQLGVEGLRKAFTGDRHAPAAPNEDEARRLENADLSAAPDDVRADVPEWVASRLEKAFGAAWVEEGGALARRPPLDMRANRLKATRDEVLPALKKFGAVATPYAPDGMRIAATEGDGRHPNVQVEPAFQEGRFEIQDEGSQIAALVAAPKAGERVLDLCAGAGGKTLALASAMGSKGGAIIATDTDRMRLAPIFERVRRAGATNVQVREAKAPLHDLEGAMDAVLIDAPCTGSGVWRRRPDSKWKLTPEAVEARVGEQRALLADASAYVRPGGWLVYVTCSLLPDENEDQVAAFLDGRADFAAMPPAEVIPAAGLPAALAEAVYLGPAGLTLTPRTTGTDGFFISVLRRV